MGRDGTRLELLWLCPRGLKFRECWNLQVNLIPYSPYLTFLILGEGDTIFSLPPLLLPGQEGGRLRTAFPEGQTAESSPGVGAGIQGRTALNTNELHIEQ